LNTIESDGYEPFGNNAEKTFVNLGLVLSVALEDIPALKESIGRSGARIIYQKKSILRLEIVEKSQNAESSA